MLQTAGEGEKKREGPETEFTPEGPARRAKTSLDQETGRATAVAEAIATAIPITDQEMVMVLSELTEEKADDDENDYDILEGMTAAARDLDQ